MRNLIEGRSQPPARWVTHCVDIRSSRIEYLGNQPVQSRAVRANLAFELQSFADAHDGHAVIADCSRNQHGIASLGAMRTNVDARPQHAHSGSIDVAAVAMPALNDFRISGYDLDARSRSSRSHRIDDCSQLRQGKSFFQDEAGA